MQIVSSSSYLPVTPPSLGAKPAVDASAAPSAATVVSPPTQSIAAAEADANQQQAYSQQQAQLELSRLVRRDREVRAHEQAHAAIGGQHAGAPAYSYTYGPDDKRYASAGEVPIDLSTVSGDPAATVRKMAQVLAAALAPAEPSAQDRQIAAQAQLLMRQAQAELLQLQTEREPAQTASTVAADEPLTIAGKRQVAWAYATLPAAQAPGSSINVQV